jgi:hypothetical protein
VFTLSRKNCQYDFPIDLIRFKTKEKRKAWDAERECCYGFSRTRIGGGQALRLERGHRHADARPRHRLRPGMDASAFDGSGARWRLAARTMSPGSALAVGPPPAPGAPKAMRPFHPRSGPVLGRHRTTCGEPAPAQAASSFSASACGANT